MSETQTEPGSAKTAGRDLPDRDVQTFVNRMSNWQRHQWARAGRSKRKDQLEKFVELLRPLSAKKMWIWRPDGSQVRYGDTIKTPIDIERIFAQIAQVFPKKVVKEEPKTTGAPRKGK